MGEYDCASVFGWHVFGWHAFHVLYTILGMWVENGRGGLARSGRVGGRGTVWGNRGGKGGQEEALWMCPFVCTLVVVVGRGAGGDSRRRGGGASCGGSRRLGGWGEGEWMWSRAVRGGGYA